MLIRNQAISAASRLYAGAQVTGTRRVDAAGAVQAPDALELSGEVQSFGDILQQLRGMDDVRKARVETLSACVQNDAYAPAASDIAAKMLAMRY